MKKVLSIFVLISACICALAQPDYVAHYTQNGDEGISIKKNVVKSSTKKGDVNGDGVVNAADIVEIVNIIMNPSDDDEEGGGNTSSLLGDWEIVKIEYYSDDGDYDVEDGDGGYYTFTATTMTVHIDEDVLNGRTLNYSIVDDTFKIEGIGVFQILERTSTIMKYRTEIVFGYAVVTLMKK